MSKENQGEKRIFIPDLLQLLWNLKWHIAGVTFLVMFVTFVIVNLQESKYMQETWIMLNNTESNKTEVEILSDVSNIYRLNSLENEMFILKSPTMMKKVVESMGLNTRYYHFESPFFGQTGVSLFDTKRVEYYEDAPFLMTFEQDNLLPQDMHLKTFSVKFEHADTNRFYIKELLCDGKPMDFEEDEYGYGKEIKVGRAYFTIEPQIWQDLKSGSTFMCTWAQPSVTAGYFSGNLSVQRSGNKSDVVVLSYTDRCLKRAKDILNTLVLMVNNEAREYANVTQKRTIEFIDGRLESLSADLDTAENNYHDFQSSNRVVDLYSQSQIAITSERDYRNQLNEVRVQLEVIHMVSDYLNNQTSGKYGVIPANIGVNDSELKFILADYNNLAVERNRMVANSSESNPRVINLNTQLEEQRKSIKSTIDNLERIYTIKERELLNTLSANKLAMSIIPQQQFRIQQLSRKIDVIEPLFLLLQQKREEAQISICSQIDKFFVIEPAFGSQSPVAPHPRKALAIAFLIGLCIAPLFAFLRSQLRTKVETRDDVTAKVSSPVISVIAKANLANGGTLLPLKSRDACSETFSVLRTNLQYMPGAKVIQVTSSVPDEGKTFISSNLAVSLASVGKKVVLLGFDLRKPALRKIFKKKDIVSSKTIVGYLLGKTDNPEDLVIPSEVVENLDIVVCGPIPHNPLDLMAKGDLDKLFGYFRGRYDYVIVDSTPYFPVADASVVNKYADATLFVIRANYSELRLLDEIENATKSTTRPIRNVNIVLNGYDAKKARYSYGYSRNYGYVYGYGDGYGNDAESDDNKDKS